MILEENGIDPSTATLDKIVNAKKAAQEKYLAVAFLLGSDCNQYRTLIKNLENKYTRGQDRYPKMVTLAYSLLTNWKQDARNFMCMIGPANNAVAFANIDGNNDDDLAINTNGQKGQHPPKKKSPTGTTCTSPAGAARKGTMQRITCMARLLKRQQMPHRRPLCSWQEWLPLSLNEDHAHFQFFQTASYAECRSVILNQASGAILKAWILLNNQSTVDELYNNKDLLKNIRKSTTHMDIHCNAGISCGD
jgi:hypothetical protein